MLGNLLGNSSRHLRPSRAKRGHISQWFRLVTIAAREGPTHS